MQGLNKSIVNLKENIKNRSVHVYKEVKTYSLRAQNSTGGLSLEDKLDCEFLERIMKVYVFFTSCLNLGLQNDKEAHKLIPMIEKHITELKLEQLSVQASSVDIFEDLNFSSIGNAQSSNSSSLISSINNTTMLNALTNNNKSITPKRKPSDTSGLTVP